MPYKYVPARLISTFKTNNKHLGRPNMTIRHSFINDIEFFLMLIQPVLSIVGPIFPSIKKYGQS